jgi:acyl-coenzyme A thioesterase PaaI-like protein
MSIYKKIWDFASKYICQHKLFKYGLNLSPVYRRTTGRVVSVSENLMEVQIKIPISYKNRNYVNTIFGGSMFAAVDPIPMMQLMNILGNEYVVWDKSVQILFKRPAKETIYADFEFTQDEISEIQERVASKKEIEIIKTCKLTSEDKQTIYCEISKTIYIADRLFYLKKRNTKQKQV